MNRKKHIVTFYELNEYELNSFAREKRRSPNPKIIIAAVLAVIPAGAAAAVFALTADRSPRNNSVKPADSTIMSQPDSPESSSAAAADDSSTSSKLPDTSRESSHGDTESSPPDTSSDISSESSSDTSSESSSDTSSESSADSSNEENTRRIIPADVQETIYSYLYYNDIFLSPSDSFFGQPMETIIEVFGLTDDMYTVETGGNGEKELSIEIYYGDDTTEDIGILFSADDKVIAVGSSRTLGYGEQSYLDDIKVLIGDPTYSGEEFDDEYGTVRNLYSWENDDYLLTVGITNLGNDKNRFIQILYLLES